MRFCVEGMPGIMTMPSVAGQTMMAATMSFLGMSARSKSSAAMG